MHGKFPRDKTFMTGICSNRNDKGCTITFFQLNNIEYLVIIPCMQFFGKT